MSEVSYFLWKHQYTKEGDKDLLDNVVDNFFMGHVRAATKGDVKDENAHPFDVDHIIGAHNGTLHDTKYQDKNKTDSEMMFIDIAKRGLPVVLKDLLPTSAFAISMFDKENKELVFVRNEKRPLCYAFNKKRRVLYWASEKGMLEFCANRRNIEIGTIYKFTDDTIYTVKPYEIEMNHRWRIRPLKPVQFPVVDNVVRGQGNLTSVLLDVPALPKPPLNLNLRKVPKQNILVQCIYCQKPMDLLEQYKGIEVDTNVYSCKTCDEVNAATIKQIEAKVG